MPRLCRTIGPKIYLQHAPTNNMGPRIRPTSGQLSRSNWSQKFSPPGTEKPEILGPEIRPTWDHFSRRAWDKNPRQPVSQNPAYLGPLFPPNLGAKIPPTWDHFSRPTWTQKTRKPGPKKPEKLGPISEDDFVFRNWSPLSSRVWVLDMDSH